VCYSVTALYRRYRAVTDFETRVTISKESVCCTGQSAGSRIAAARVHLQRDRDGDKYIKIHRYSTHTCQPLAYSGSAQLYIYIERERAIAI